MSLNQLKRALWVMNELMAAGPYGISRDTLCRRWELSVCNDKKWEGPLTERTFYRLRNELESIFNVNIQCSNDGEKRYWVERTEHSVFLEYSR